MEDSTALETGKENQESGEEGRPWDEMTAASTQDPQPGLSEHPESEQGPDTGPQPGSSPPRGPPGSSPPRGPPGSSPPQGPPSRGSPPRDPPSRGSPPRGPPSRGSPPVDDLAGPGASPSAPPREPSSPPPQALSGQLLPAPWRSDKTARGIPEAGTPHPDHLQQSSDEGESTPHQTGQSKGNAFQQLQQTHGHLYEPRDANRNNSKQEDLRCDISQEEDSDSKRHLDEPEPEPEPEAAPSMLEIAVQSSKAYLLKTSSKSGLNL